MSHLPGDGGPLAIEAGTAWCGIDNMAGRPRSDFLYFASLRDSSANGHTENGYDCQGTLLK